MAIAGVYVIFATPSAEHSLADPSHEPENGSFILTREWIQGWSAADQSVALSSLLKIVAWGFTSVVESPLHLQADLCASCHQVYHYDAHFPLEATYLEWKHGLMPKKDVLCQDCHMVDIPTFMRTADEFRKPERKEYRHFFNGANYLIYYLAEGAAKKR